MDRNGSQSKSGQNPEAIVNAESSATDRSIQNFRSLFVRYSSPAGGSRPVASLGQARPLSQSAPPNKRRKATVYVARETWTHEFLCLANTNDKHQPSRAEKFQL